MTNWLSTIGAALVAGVVFFYIGRGTVDTPAPITVRDSLIVPVIVTDTLVRIEYRSLPARIETVTVEGANESHVTASTEQVVASGEYRDTVAVVYHFPPHNLFDVTLGLQPRRRETSTVYITQRPDCPTPSFLDRIAVGPGFSMTYASGKLHFGPSISVSFDVLP